MVSQIVKNKVHEYKQDIARLEKIVKEWEVEFRIKDISKRAEACYEAFNDLQMALAKIADPKEKEKFDRQCYKNTYQFLEFIENQVDVDFCVLLMNKAKPFSNLIVHYSKYCSGMEKKYNIELDSERKLGISCDQHSNESTSHRK